LVDAANARYTDPKRNRIVNETPGEPPRCEVYHFFLSMCSYKVRAVLDDPLAQRAPVAACDGILWRGRI